MTTVKYFCHKTPTVMVMPLDEFIINVFCLVDDFYTTQLQKPLRQRGTAPKLSDSEVMGWFAPPKSASTSNTGFHQ